MQVKSVYIKILYYIIAHKSDSCMIELDIDLSYLAKYFDIGSRNISELQNKTINEIIKEQSDGSKSVANKIARELLRNPRNIYKLFKLTNPNNRYLLLSHMDKDDLKYILQFLDIKELMLGMGMFTKEMLLECMLFLSPESLAKISMEQMDIDKFMKNMPEEYLDKFFESDKIDPDVYEKALQNIPEHKLQKMMAQYSKKDCSNMKKEEVISKLTSLSGDELKNSMKSFDLDSKRLLAANIVKEKNELLQEFPPEAFIYSMKDLDKSKIIESMEVLDFKDFSKMFDKMPKELLAVVATQINPEIFAVLLGNHFDDLLGRVVT